MRRPLNTLATARWPWLMMSALVCVAAAGFILLLQAREHEARGNEAIARQFAANLPMGTRPDAAPLLAALARQEPQLLETTVRRQIALLLRQVGTLDAIDRSSAAQIRATLLRAQQQRSGRFLLTGLEFRRAARISNQVAAAQAARASQTERDSLLGSIGALGFATVLVGILLSRERRLTLRAARAHAAEIQHLADHDGLTGVLNRRRFDEALHALSDSGAGPVEIVICDVNGLKSINDRFGHHAGDGVLVSATQDLGRVLAGRGTVYRTGGDEFSIISQPGVRIADLARQAFERDGTTVASVGAATWPTDRALAREVVSLADTRMYDAKRAMVPAAVAREIS